jgi:hypothetical protein
MVCAAGRMVMATARMPCVSMLGRGVLSRRPMFGRGVAITVPARHDFDRAGPRRTCVRKPGQEV